MTEFEAELVLLAMPDVNGSFRGKALRPNALRTALRDGVATTNLLLALDPTDTPIADYEHFGIRAGAGDLLVRPEQETLRELSWRPGWQLCLGTPSWPDGRQCELAPREVLRKALGQLETLGYGVVAAIEYEVRLWDGDGHPMSSGISYSIAEIARFDGFIAALTAALETVGVELAAVHTEAGPGLLELNLDARPGLQAADDAAFVKFAVKEVAASLGLRASFLAKTAPGEEGSSGHIHLSCWANHENEFVSGPDAQPMAGAIAGVLEHLPAASLLLNPTVNSYKRLVPGWFAPVNATWGVDNRSCAVRAINPPQPNRCRIECRRPGADANPYLALAVIVASAAEGIQRKATPPSPLEGDVSLRSDVASLPGSLEGSLHEFASDHALRAMLGEAFSAYYEVSRRWELKAWQQTVTNWERERYERAV